MSDYDYPFRLELTQVWWKLPIGMLVAALIFFGSKAFPDFSIAEAFRFLVTYDRLFTAVGFGGLLFVTVIAGAGEEIFVRGFVGEALEEGAGLNVFFVIILTSLLFAALHLLVYGGWAGIGALIAAFFFGLIASVLLIVSGDLAVPIGFHMMMNFLIYNSLHKVFVVVPLGV